MAQAIIAKLDPSRIVYHHSSGNLGMMWTSNFYLNFVPVQERSDWFEHWATKGVKPIFTTEYGMPYFLNWTMYRGYFQGKLPWQGHQGNVPYELCIAEWDSQWLGDSAFRLSEEEKTDLRWEAKKFNAGQLWQHWEYPVYFADPVFDGVMEVVARYTADNWRAFRTWGVSGDQPLDVRPVLETPQGGRSRPPGPQGRLGQAATSRLQPRFYRCPLRLDDLFL